MKKLLFTLMFVFASLMINSSCITPSEIELEYQYEYAINGIIYPVYYIDGYPYYWYDSRWILIPYDRYDWIRYRYYPGHIYIPRSYYHRYHNDRYHYSPRPRGHRPDMRPHNPPRNGDSHRFGERPRTNDNRYVTPPRNNSRPTPPPSNRNSGSFGNSNRSFSTPTPSRQPSYSAPSSRPSSGGSRPSGRSGFGGRR